MEGFYFSAALLWVFLCAGQWLCVSLSVYPELKELFILHTKMAESLCLGQMRNMEVGREDRGRSVCVKVCVNLAIRRVWVCSRVCVGVSGRRW